MDKDQIRDYELDIIVKAWRDERFRKNLLKDPKKAIEAEFNISIPADVHISVHEESENSLHLIVPSVPKNFEAGDLSDDELRDVIGGVMVFGHMGAMPAGDRSRLRLLQKENEQQKKTIAKLEAELRQHKG